MSSKNLLVELLVEELPPKALKKLDAAFADSVFTGLQEAGLLAAGSSMRSFATPRRLAVHITEVAAKADDHPVAHKLMPSKIGLDTQGKATPALLKKLVALGADDSAITKLRTEHDGKNDMLYLDSMQSGTELASGLQQVLSMALDKLPIPKVMTYQLADGWESVHFVRPAHGLVALHGSDIINVSVLGLQAGNSTQGHRFEAKHKTLTLRSADSYTEQLRDEGAVIASFAERHAEIVRQLTAAAAAENLHPVEDGALLDEVTALVERPNVLLGQFEAEYLQIPQECLILTMKANQKYFPLLDARGKLTNKFLIVANIRPDDPTPVITGNERVVRPRLADARFFYEQDRKKTLESRLSGLDKVVYHNQLGSQGERSLRVQGIARDIGTILGGDALAQQAHQAAALAKADLLTDMVGEFPELQGIMGRYYALQEGLDEEIAYAIEDHYKPRFSGDALPRNPVGICVALADKLETLVGMFAIGNIPTGDKDPYALRRHALGILRILLEKAVPINLKTLMALAGKRFMLEIPTATIEVFLIERLAGLLREQDYSSHEVEAVLAHDPDQQMLHQLPHKLAAVRAFSALPQAAALAAANKRVSNILKKVSDSISATVNPALLQEAAEKALDQALIKVQPVADAAFASGNYTAALQSLAALKEPVDRFFDDVMVNAESADLRNNRLALLAQLHTAMNRVADLSKLAG